MASQTWSFLRNPFEYATRDSYLRAAIIGTFTEAALKSDPSLSALFNYYFPFVDKFNTLYNTWQQQAGSQKSNTKSLGDVLALATANINEWDYQVQGTFRRGTAEYDAIFPKGHAPFQQGGQQSRIDAFGTLILALNQAGLATVEALVKNYYHDLKVANSTQKGAIVQTGQKSKDLDTARVEMCDALYYVLGGLMQKFSKTPDVVGKYFKLDLIQHKEQKVFTGHLAAGAVHLVVQRTLAADAEIDLLNGGAEKLLFFFSDRADAPPPTGAVGVTVLPGTSQTVRAAQLGPVDKAHYLYVFNPSNAPGEWEVDI